MKKTKRTISKHIRAFIMAADLQQLKKMKTELAGEIEAGLLKDRPEHSYSLELSLIKKRIAAKSK